MADKRRAFTGAIVNRGSVGICHGGRIHDLILAAGRIDTMQIYDRRSDALQRVVHRFGIGRPISVADRRSDPVRIRHDFIERQCRLRRGLRDT